MADGELTHMDDAGNVRMVDVSSKNSTKRIAVAESFISLPGTLLEKFSTGDFTTKKGSVVQTSILAGIMAAKKTADLIPLCHPLQLSKCDVRITHVENGLRAVCEVHCTGQTGVEMEALTGASVAVLTIYDMCKSYGHEMEITRTRLIRKSGGKSDYEHGAS